MSSFSDHARTASAPRTEHAVPAHARELAARLSTLFEQDRGIVVRLSSAQRRLRLANDRLRRSTPEVFKPIENASPVAMRDALSEIHGQIHHAFCEYQAACEERRQLACEVGELAAGLTDALCAAGFDRRDARRADVHRLAHAEAWPATGTGEAW